jgi:hypothetical protein
MEIPACAPRRPRTADERRTETLPDVGPRALAPRRHRDVRHEHTPSVSPPHLQWLSDPQARFPGFRRPPFAHLAGDRSTNAHGRRSSELVHPAVVHGRDRAAPVPRCTEAVPLTDAAKTEKLRFLACVLRKHAAAKGVRTGGSNRLAGDVDCNKRSCSYGDDNSDASHASPVLRVTAILCAMTSRRWEWPLHVSLLAHASSSQWRGGQRSSSIAWRARFSAPRPARPRSALGSGKHAEPRWVSSPPVAAACSPDPRDS